MRRVLALVAGDQRQTKIIYGFTVYFGHVLLTGVVTLGHKATNTPLCVLAFKSRDYWALGRLRRVSAVRSTRQFCCELDQTLGLVRHGSLAGIVKFASLSREAIRVTTGSKE